MADDEIQAAGESPDQSDPVQFSGGDNKSSVRTAVKNRTAGKKPASGAPSLDEWQDFFGRIVLRTLTDGYMHLVLKDVELTEREEQSLKLDKDELNEMAAPFSSLANKSKVMRKHGRAIIAATDSYEAVICMVMWARRVNRIAKRHKVTVSESQSQPSMHHQPQDIYEGVVVDEPATAPANEGQAPAQPFVRVVNPGGG